MIQRKGAQLSTDSRFRQWIRTYVEYSNRNEAVKELKNEDFQISTGNHLRDCTAD